MNKNKRNYDKLTEITAQYGMVPYVDNRGDSQEGFYTLKGYHAPVDLSDCAEDEKSIFLTVLKQLSGSVDDVFNGITNVY